MLVTLQEVYNAFITIRSLEKEKSSSKWAYGLVKNRTLMQHAIEKISVIERKVWEADKERIAYCELTATKDSNGIPIVEKGADNLDHYKGVKEDDPVILKHAKKILDLKKGYEEKVDIDLHKIDFSDVPDISPSDYEKLAILIKEPE